MKISLFKNRLVPVPTLAGLACLLLLAGTPLFWWCFKGESFFCLTERYPADGLVLEGWIGIEGARAAKTEFEQGHYRYIITAGGPTNSRWEAERWNFATEASRVLISLGIPSKQVIAAPATNSGNHRTFESAAFVRQALEKHQLHPASLNVFTLGAHARRSRLVFAKAMPSSIQVGVVSWIPPGFLQGPWWQSSERSLDLIKETIGYLFELLLNSGRTSNAPAVERNE